MEDHTKDRIAEALRELIEERNHYHRLARVFGSPEGFEVLEWLLELTGYWRPVNENKIELFELGRKIFHHVSLGDMDIAHRLLDSRRERVLREIKLKSVQLEEKMKET